MLNIRIGIRQGLLESYIPGLGSEIWQRGVTPVAGNFPEKSGATKRNSSGAENGSDGGGVASNLSVRIY